MGESKVILRIFSFIAQRMLVVYITLAVVLAQVIDFQRINYKMLDNLQTTPRYLLDYAKGERTFDLKQFKNGIRYYKYYRASFPEAVTALSAIGYCHYHMGREDLAINYYRKTLTRNSDLFGVHYNLGVLLFQQGRFQQAAKAFEAAVNVPFEQAFQTMEVIIPEARAVPIDAGIDSGGFVQTKVRQWQRSYAKGYQYLIEVYRHLKRPEDVLQVVMRAVSLSEDFREYFYFQAGVAAFSLGEFQQAVTFLRRSLSLFPDNPEAYRYLYLSFQELGLDNLARQARQEQEKLEQAGEAANLPLDLQPKLFYYPPYRVIERDGKKIIMI